jgi:hypothetical protein
VLRLLVTVNVLSSSPIIPTLTMKAISPSETSVVQESHDIIYQKTVFLIYNSVHRKNKEIGFLYKYLYHYKSHFLAALEICYISHTEVKKNMRFQGERVMHIHSLCAVISPRMMSMERGEKEEQRS